ncbi:MAG: recombinase family protein [bacterium]
MKYFIYARKSTEDDDKQILSIQAQLAELQEYSAKEKLEIVDSLCESKTAKEPGRIKFGEMLSRIEKGEADGIISWHPDRLARNSVDGGKVIYMIDKGLIKSLKFPTFWCEPTPQGLFMLQIAFGQSKYYVDNLSQNVARGMRQKIRNGVWPDKAPIGYSNNPRTRGIDVDTSQAEKIKNMFELYAKGKYNLSQLEKWCKENNFKSNKGKELSKGRIQDILKNIFYFSLMKYKGEIFQGTHEPVISKKLFDECQEVMKKRGRVHEVRKHHFAFLGLMKCGSCECSVTAELQKGHHYYRCTKKKGVCQEKRYLREEKLVEQIKYFFQKVSLSSNDTEKVLAELLKDEKKAKAQSFHSIQNLKIELKEIETKLDKLVDLYLSGGLSTTEHAKKKRNICLAKSND